MRNCSFIYYRIPSVKLDVVCETDGIRSTTHRGGNELNGKSIADRIDRLENSRLLFSTHKAFIVLLPILMIGSFALTLQNFPLDLVQNFYQTAAGGFLNRVLLCINNVTTGFVSVYLVFGVSMYYSQTIQEEYISLQIAAAFTAFASFLASFGLFWEEDTAQILPQFKTVGIFTALVVSLCATKLFYWFYHLLQAKRSKRMTDTDIRLSNTLESILPMTFCILIFMGVNVVLQFVFHVSDFNDLIAKSLNLVFTNLHDDLWEGVTYVFLLSFLWMFGIHGGNVLDQVTFQVFEAQAISGGSVISKTLLDHFVSMGGCGTTICLLIACLLAAKNKRNRRIALTAAPFSLFNINEIVIFGLPVFMNPVLLIPFILVPLSSLLVTYGAVYFGIMPPVSHTVTWTIPVLFSGYVATGSVMGAVVQLVNIVIGTLIYIPFVKLFEKRQQEQKRDAIDCLTAEFKQGEENKTETKFLKRSDRLGEIARELTERLHADIKRGAVPVWFQPQVDIDGRVFGAESLLRWKYEGITLYPPLLVSLAKADGAYEALTEAVLRASCAAVRSFLSVEPGFSVSVNITADQLNDRHFVEKVIRLVQEEGVCGNLGLEITEEASVLHMEQYLENIQLLKQHQIPVAIDDFSMGQTSIQYLQTNAFGCVKIDGSLVRPVAENPRCREIIASITGLGEKLHFTIIAECVENEKIRRELIALGCTRFQGYLYGPAVPQEEFLKEFLKPNLING